MRLRPLWVRGQWQCCYGSFLSIIISGQMDSYLYRCDYTIKAKMLKNGFFLTMGKVSNSFSELFWLNSRISLTRVHPHMKLGGDIDFGDTQGIGLLVNTLLFGKPQ